MNAPVHDFELPGIKTINANGHLIHYAEHGAGWRYDTLLEKEPETIEWIDTFEPGDTLWDIGANVGIYSIYAGVKGIRTFAFEPHFANYHQLCLTTALNGLQDLVTPLCLAFTESKSVAEMNLASLDIGASMSNYGEALDFRGKPFEPAFRQGMIGYDIDSFIADFGMEVPTHVKIDVDGIELPIVRGARAMLANPELRSVSIELIESDVRQVEEVTQILRDAGLHFIRKKHNSAFATAETRDVLNYLFHRDPAKLESLLADTSADEGSITTDQIVAQIVRRIDAAPVDAEPSGNIFMEEMLPEAVYRELIARLPADDALDPIEHPDAVTADGRVSRHLLDLTPASLKRLDPDNRPFWAAMIEVFQAPEIAQAILAKFAPTLRERFGDAMPELVAVPILYRDHPGYRIGIHPDSASKIATLQFYLPEDDSQLHLGTCFHRRTADGFEEVKTNAFKPNSAYAFVRSEESWHSVDELGPTEKMRNTIALTFYIKGQEYRSDGTAEEPATYYDEHMAEAFRTLAMTFTQRDDVATLFREGGVGVELGVAAGDFSERILQYDHVGYLFSIDMWAGDRGHGVDQYREAIARLAPYRDRNATLRMRFDEAIHLFGDESLDFIYVDGYAHDGELNGATFREWFPKLKRGGIIAGDDYHGDWPLVVGAVDAFVAANGLELHVIQCQEDSWNSKYPTWFAMKPDMYEGKIFLQRPARDAILDHGRAVLDLEAQALGQLSGALDEEFASAVELILRTHGRVVVSGMGKSGHVARKMAATFASTGTPAIFVHPGEAAHGDLGMLLAEDLLVVLSNSGATPELRPIMHYADRLGCPIVGITSQRHSPMGQIATTCLTLPTVREACPANISPTTSTTLMLALGDALAVATMSMRGVSREQLEQLHPGGAIGTRLLPINEIMHSGDALPLVPEHLPMREVLVTMTEKSLGIAGVVDPYGRLAGTITDGDLRRNVDRLLTSIARDVMTVNPKTIPDGTYVEDARAIMSANRITALFVMDHDAPDRPIGLVHIHDFSRLGLS